MSEILELAGGRYYGEPGEVIVVVVPATVADVLGIVCLRPNGLYYVSVLSRTDYGGGISEWGAMAGVLDRSIVESAEGGRQLLEDVLRSHGYVVRARLPWHGKLLGQLPAEPFDMNITLIQGEGL